MLPPTPQPLQRPSVPLEDSWRRCVGRQPRPLAVVAVGGGGGGGRGAEAPDPPIQPAANPPAGPARRQS